MFIYFLILRVKQFPFEKSAALHSEAPETKNLNNHEQTRMKNTVLSNWAQKKAPGESFLIFQVQRCGAILALGK